MVGVNETTADGVPLVVGMELWHVQGGPYGRLVEVRSGGLELLVRHPTLDSEANWWASNAYSTMEAADKAAKERA